MFMNITKEVGSVKYLFFYPANILKVLDNRKKSAREISV